MDTSTTTFLTGLFTIAGFLISFITIITMFFKIPVVNVNSVDSDQMPHSAASDLGVHCLPLTLFGASRLSWVNVLCLFCISDLQ